MTIDLPRPSGTPDLTMTPIEPLAPMLGARGGPHDRVSRGGGVMIFVNALFLHCHSSAPSIFVVSVAATYISVGRAVVFSADWVAGSRVALGKTAVFARGSRLPADCGILLAESLSAILQKAAGQKDGGFSRSNAP
jgi:hypothetical protein